MQEYIEVFRCEAKSLLKSFQNNEENAVTRCQAVFGDKTDLSLMNIQHVIAKEYGFNGWNELKQAQDWELAEALVKAKNKIFVSPFKSYDGKIITKIERGEYQLRKPEERQIDMSTFINHSGYNYLPLEHVDISDYDLSGLDVLDVQYTEDTKWPSDESKMPKGFKPKEFLEYRKNPGLGIRQLHKQGIDGRGRKVAIIDLFRLVNHVEYHNQLKGYEEIDIDINRHDSGGCAFASALVGRTCGIAPKAELYYFAVKGGRTQIYYAEAIEKVCELHKKLVNEGKSGIDAILINAGITNELFKNEEGYIQSISALEKANNLGIWCYVGGHNLKKHEMWRSERVYCKADGDVDDPNDFLLDKYSVLNKIPLEQEELFRNSLCFPSGGITVASEDKMNGYAFIYKVSRFSAAYAVGLYLLAKDVKPDLTAEEYWRLGIETGDFRKGIGTIINPQRLINKLWK